MVPRRTGIIAIIVIAIIAASTAGAYVVNPELFSINAPGTNNKLQIVAGENFWGSLVSQLGGTHAQVLSIVSDPNADPHEYESNAANARAIANAHLVIVNGAGYDDWALRLIAANGNQNQKVLNVANLLGKKAGDNPHFWYSPIYINQTVHQMYLDLASIDKGNAAYYERQYTNLNVSLGPYNNRINVIAQKFAGTRVASTESIFEYLSHDTRLNLISPPEFMKAVAEGFEPSPQDVIAFHHMLVNGTSPGNATVLVYNEQTITATTNDLKIEATQDYIPVVAVTETIQPPDVSFQDWMNAELIQLQNALNQQALAK
jgi:zinc/manganese transport system substrate-binding protein